MKQITKIVTFYDDGTFTESFPDLTNQVTKPSFYNQCPVCNMYMSGPRGYVCGVSHCPSQLRVTS